MASGCGCKEVYRFPHTTPLVSILFCSSIPTFCSFKKMFFVLVQIPFVIKFYVLKYFFRSINTNMGDYGHPTAAI